MTTHSWPVIKETTQFLPTYPHYYYRATEIRHMESMCLQQIININRKLNKSFSTWINVALACIHTRIIIIDILLLAFQQSFKYRRATYIAKINGVAATLIAIMLILLNAVIVVARWCIHY